MRAVVQRVIRAEVRVEGDVGSCGAGVMVLVGVHAEDADADADWLASKGGRAAHLLRRGGQDEPGSVADVNRRGSAEW